MIAGINYPWTTYQGRANYGCDFGTNIWNCHTGVTAHLDEVRADLEAMASSGIQVVRWFVFTDGRGGLQWDVNRNLIDLAPRFFDDMDAALTIAAEVNLQLCLVLLDFEWVSDAARRAAVRVEGGSCAFIGRALDPMLDRYGPDRERADLGRAIHSFDIINEPDWVTRGLTANDDSAAWSIAELRAFVNATADRLHDRTNALVTLGGGRVTHAREWNDPVYGLDFVQVHSYPDVRYPDRDESVFGRDAASFALNKPLLIGECPSDPRRHPEGHLSPAFTLADYFDLARAGGYLGAWPWSFKGTDAFGPVDMEALYAGLRRLDQVS